jgi:Zn-dependent protease
MTISVIIFFIRKLIKEGVVCIPAAMTDKKNSYPSFHDLSPREYMYFPKATMDLGKPGSFSRLELMHLAIAMIALTIAFSFALSRTNLLMILLGLPLSLTRFLEGLGLSFIGIVCAFFFHELAHKFMAQSYGLWSEFRMYPKGLVSALVLSSLTGFLFAVPGSVMFRGEPRLFEEGRIAVAGSLANLAIAVLTLPILFFVTFEQEGFLAESIGYICIINAVLAVFNLLPFGPLDGRVVFKWNSAIWSILFIAAVTVLAFLFPYITTLFS